MYFLITGQAPFADRSSTGKILAHAADPPRPVRDLRPEVPEAVASILDRLLAKRPEGRFASARDLIAALDTLADSTTSPPRRLVFRNLAIAAAVLLLAGGITFVALNREPSKTLTPNDPPQSGELQVSWHINHYRPKQREEDLEPLGRLGQAGSAAKQEDRLALVAQFSEPAYPYLLAINPDGSVALLVPDPKGAPLAAPVRQLRAPLENTKYYTLDDAGFQGLVLLVSAAPMPEFDNWRPKLDPKSWRQIKTELAWSFDGQRLVPMSAERIGVAEHGPKALADICRDLQSRLEKTSVRAAAFPVRP